MNLKSSVSIDQIKQLRDQTGLSIAQCREALNEASGDIAKALGVLQSKAGAIAEKKSGRTLGAGVVSSYIHNTKKIGALVELACETDFVAKNEEFVVLAYDIAMQVAATDPTDISALLALHFIKNGEQTIAQLIESAIQKFGEKVVISRFARFAVGS